MIRIGVLRVRLDEAMAEIDRLRASSFVTAVPSEEYERLLSENKLVREESDRHYQLWVDSQAEVERLTFDALDNKTETEATRIKNARLQAEVNALMTNPTSRLLRAERAENARLKAEVEQLTFDPLTYLDDQGEWIPRHIHLAAVERLQAEVERLDTLCKQLGKQHSDISCENIMLRKVGDEMAELFGGDYSDIDGVCYDKKWNAAKEGKPSV